MPSTITTSHTLVEKNYQLISSTIKAAVISYLASKGSKMPSHEVEDVCSDSMYKVLVNASTFSTTKASLKTWVSTIAVRTLLDAIESKKVRNKRFVRSDEGWERDAQATYENPTNVTPEDYFIAEQTSSTIDEFYENSSDQDKIILDMTEQGFKTGEIAAALGKTPAAVYVAKSKLLGRLSTTLAA